MYNNNSNTAAPRCPSELCYMHNGFTCRGCGRTLREIEDRGLWLQRSLLILSAELKVKGQI